LERELERTKGEDPNPFLMLWFSRLMIPYLSYLMKWKHMNCWSFELHNKTWKTMTS
jgi:hypothetical protein